MLQKKYHIGLVMALLAASPLLAADKWSDSSREMREGLITVHPKVLVVRIPPFSVIKREIEKSKGQIINFFKNDDYRYTHIFTWNGFVTKITFENQDRGGSKLFSVADRKETILNKFLAEDSVKVGEISLTNPQSFTEVKFSYLAGFYEKMIVTLEIPRKDYEKCAFADVDKKNVTFTPAVEGNLLESKLEETKWTEGKMTTILPMIQCHLKASYKQNLQDMSFDSLIAGFRSKKIDIQKIKNLPDDFLKRLPTDIYNALPSETIKRLES